MACSAIAQAPERMTYQAVVRDAQNEIVANQGVTFEVSISQTTTTGTVVFEESHSPITNVNGLFTVVLGTGIPVSGSLSAIDWSQGPYFLNSTVKTAGSIIQGSTQLVSVPYSFYAESAGSIANIDVYLQNNAYFDTAVTNVVNNLGISNPVVGGSVVNDSLILTLNDGTTINAGLAQGPQGPAGADGQDGAQGPQGVAGPQGATGPQGLTGAQGPQGLTGPQGPAGADGQDGAQGPQGLPGPQGPAGADGQDGVQGPQGLPGPQGPAGADGQDGAQGPQGLPGPQGPAGADGQDGAQGPQGLTGAQGPAGADGQDGAQGPQGVAGPQGPAGADGQDGVSIVNTEILGDSLYVTLDNGQVLNAGGLSGSSQSSGQFSGTSMISLDTISPYMRYIGDGREGDFFCSSFSGVLSGEHFYRNFTVENLCQLDIEPSQTTIIHVSDTCFIDGLINGEGFQVAPFTANDDNCIGAGQTKSGIDKRFEWEYTPPWTCSTTRISVLP